VRLMRLETDRQTEANFDANSSATKEDEETAGDERARRVQGQPETISGCVCRVASGLSADLVDAPGGSGASGISGAEREVYLPAARANAGIGGRSDVTTHSAV